MMAYTRTSFPFITAQQISAIAILLHLGKAALMAKIDLLKTVKARVSQKQCT